MTAEEKVIADFVDFLLERWAIQEIKNRQADIRKRKIIASSDLLNSMAYEVRRATKQQAAALFLHFEGYGRYLDLRRVDRRNQIPLEAIKEWIKEKGISSFKRPSTGKPPKTPERAINEIAWGIVKKKKRIRHKPKRWFMSGLYKDLNILIRELSIGYRERTKEQIVKSLTEGLKTKR